MFNHILVPLDGSHFSEGALPYAKELAHKFHGRITLLRVVPPPELFVNDMAGGTAEFLLKLRDQAENEAANYLNMLQATLRQENYAVDWHIVGDGMVAESILAAAEAHKVDVIVMTTHGRTGIGRWVFGSVAEKVLRQAPVPTLLIRSTDNEKKPG